MRREEQVYIYRFSLKKRGNWTPGRFSLEKRGNRSPGRFSLYEGGSRTQGRISPEEEGYCLSKVSIWQFLFNFYADPIQFRILDPNWKNMNPDPGHLKI